MIEKLKQTESLNRMPKQSGDVPAEGFKHVHKYSLCLNWGHGGEFGFWDKGSV